MKIVKKQAVNFYQMIDNKFYDQFGFNLSNVTLGNIINYMYRPKDSSSLAITRILFGLAMLFDIPDERGGASLDKRWGDPRTCHFPLLPLVQPVSLPYMAVVYAALWIGAGGIMLGYKYRYSAPLFTACYWYLFLIEKSFWNNHSYLFGLVALLLSCTEAHCYWSIDSFLEPSKQKQTVPYWNYFILKYQFFILYFMAGMKKGTAEWLTGYSVQNLSEHWVFDPFKYFLSVPQTDYLVVHWFVFLFDLTVALWMMCSYTRHVAMVFCALFHLMNSRLFRIGMFPWVCLATMPLFYPFDWPKRVRTLLTVYFLNIKQKMCTTINGFKTNHDCKSQDNATDYNDGSASKNDVIKDNSSEDLKDRPINNTDINKTRNGSIIDREIDSSLGTTGQGDKDEGNYTDEKEHTANYDYKKKKITIFIISIYVFVQAFLPYSHFITKGYNNWTNGLYGYSWDMMVHTWDSSSVTIKVVDNVRNEVLYIDPEVYTLNDRWARHGDMIYQYAHCLKNNLKLESALSMPDDPLQRLSNNISIYVDIWGSLNGRFVQRMFDSKVDMLQVNWSPFSKVSYLMPLLDEAVHWRKDLDQIRAEVHSLSKYSDVVFYADFPGYDQEKYIPVELKNVTLRVLEGLVAYEPSVDNYRIGQSYKLTSGHTIDINPGTFHKVVNIGQTPAYYMYTFYNATQNTTDINSMPKAKLPVGRELFVRFRNMIVFGNLILTNIYKLVTFSHCA